MVGWVKGGGRIDYKGAPGIAWGSWKYSAFYCVGVYIWQNLYNCTI